jgi:hypothetical protein
MDDGLGLGGGEELQDGGTGLFGGDLAIAGAR